MTDQPTDAAVEPTWQDREQANAIREAMHEDAWGLSADAHDWRADHPLLQALSAERQRAERAEAALETAATQISDLARRLGETEGRLEASDNVHIMAQWKERAERAEHYRRAIEDELIILHIFTEELAADPRRAIAAIIDWNCKIALDPSVSEAARALQQSGAERAEKLLGEAVRAHEDVVDTLAMLRRHADAEGRQLSGMAYSIANDLNFVRQISRDFLATLRAPEQPAGGEG